MLCGMYRQKGAASAKLAAGAATAAAKTAWLLAQQQERECGGGHRLGCMWPMQRHCLLAEHPLALA
jgi:hypothetical protein